MKDILLFTLIPVKRKIRINGKVKMIDDYVVVESDEWKNFKKEREKING